jgi:hypothetical protein
VVSCIPCYHHQTLVGPERSRHLANVSTYLTSKAFYYSNDYVRVRERCYYLSRDGNDALALVLREQYDEQVGTYNALKTGLWTEMSLVSPLLVVEVLRNQLLNFPSSEITLDLTGKSSPVVEQVIVAGLTNTRPLDFEESNDFIPYYTKLRGLAFRWGISAGSALKNQVWLMSEVVTEEREEKTGAEPMSPLNSL